MQRVRPKTPRRRLLKGVWRYRGKGRRLRFIPACRCSKGIRKYARRMTRLSLWREARLKQTSEQQRKD